MEVLAPRGVSGEQIRSASVEIQFFSFQRFSFCPMIPLRVLVPWWFNRTNVLQPELGIAERASLLRRRGCGMRIVPATFSNCCRAPVVMSSVPNFVR